MSLSTILISSAIAGGIILAGVGLIRYSKKLQTRLRAQFYDLLSRVLCEHFNKTVQLEHPLTPSQVEGMLIAGKHSGLIPDLHEVKLRLEYAERGQYHVSILIYRGKELTTLRLAAIDWSELPADMQTHAINTAGDSAEYILLD